MYFWHRGPPHRPGKRGTCRLSAVRRIRCRGGTGAAPPARWPRPRSSAPIASRRTVTGKPQLHCRGAGAVPVIKADQPMSLTEPVQTSGFATCIIHRNSRSSLRGAGRRRSSLAGLLFPCQSMSLSHSPAFGRAETARLLRSARNDERRM